MENIVKSFLELTDQDEYEMIKCLKDGEAVKVYLLYDRKCGRKLLLKCSQREKGCLEAEAETLSQLRANGIPALLRCFEYRGCVFLLREYIEGQTLKEYIDRKGKISVEEAAEIGIKLCGILSYLHGRQPPVIHRDIKAENAVITDERQLYIIDFGTARDYSPLSSQDTCIMGTPATAPPEQFGFGQTDERSDIYSLGILLRQLVTGEVDLKKGDVPAKISKIIRRCTDFSPDKRYGSAQELKKALSSLKRKGPPKILCAAAAAALISALAAGISVRAFDGSLYTSKSITREREQQEQDQQEQQEQKKKQNDVYRFKDSIIEAEVCRILEKDKGTVTADDLKHITSLNIVGDVSLDAGAFDRINTHGSFIQIDLEEYDQWGQVSSLEDIAAMPNITELVLCNQSISDISPLGGSKIKMLALHGNSISDISPLADCRYLEMLKISNNIISDFSPLISCSYLSYLNAGANYMEDLEDIAGIKNLIHLYLHDCPLLTDGSALGKMNRLMTLSIKPLDAAGFENISALTRLTWLEFWNTDFDVDLNRLSGLKKLNGLFIDGADIKSLDGIENFTELSYLVLISINAESLYPLSKLENLHTLDIQKGSYGDYSAIGDIPDLTELRISAGHADHVKEYVRDDVNLVIY
ncbi:MAG: protein kinase [Firmicutes bacterium]|nr:protein kinase [[Eubacterium] siraeum]MCM1487070.1 protein kinase [Bacillota bacterium]